MYNSFFNLFYFSFILFHCSPSLNFYISLASCFIAPFTPKIYWTDILLLMFIENLKVTTNMEALGYFYYAFIVFLSFLEHIVCIHICIPQKKREETEENQGWSNFSFKMPNLYTLLVYKTFPFLSITV